LTAANSLAEVRAIMATGEYARAASMLERYLHGNLEDEQGWFLLGACLDRCGKPAQALVAFEAAERLRPSFPQAINAQAAMLFTLGRWEESLSTYQRTLPLLPNDPLILANTGIVLEKLGRIDEALTHYRYALESDPHCAPALNNRGSLLQQLGRHDEALTDHLQFAQRFPNDAGGHYNCAQSLAALMRDEEALCSADAALQADPRHVRAHIVRGALLSGLARFEEARIAFDCARALAPMLFRHVLIEAGINSDDPEYLYCLRGKDRLQRCDWNGYAEFVARFADIAQRLSTGAAPADPAALAYFSLFLPLPPHVHFALARRTAALIQARAGSLAPQPRRHDRIRIGYVSPDFRIHPVAHVLSRLYELHDRGEFEVYAYSLHPNDGSGLAVRIAQGCDVFRECHDWKTDRLARQVRDDDIDILVDLAGYTDFARPELFAWRPAPINVSLIGYPATTGASYMDYRITDGIASPPDEDRYYTEKLVRLAGSCLGYDDQFIEEDAGGRSEHGLPDDAFVFCCFNNPYKIEPGIFAVWMSILKQTPHSVLWLYSPRREVESNLLREAARHGIASGRLVFAPPLPLARNAGRYRLADLYLDTPIYNGHATTMDALWAGLPVLTWQGETFAGRVGASHLTHLGLREMIASNADEYERLACSLASDPEALRVLRDKVAQMRDRSRLLRSDTLPRHLEEAYREMWRRHEAGIPPVSFDLA
jgi:protein O-GlcNAc transferase